MLKGFLFFSTRQECRRGSAGSPPIEDLELLLLLIMLGMVGGETQSLDISHELLEPIFHSSVCPEFAAIHD